MIIYNVKYKNSNEEKEIKLPTALEVQDVCSNRKLFERDDMYFYVFMLNEKVLRFDIAFDGEPGHEELVKDNAEKLVSALNLSDYKMVDMDEINNIFYADLSLARRQEFIENERSVKRYLGLPLNEPCFKETNIKTKSKTKEEILSLVQNLPSEDYLKEEIERIYTPSANPEKFGVPAHYIINSTDKQNCKEILDILAQSLVANKRILRNKYAVINLDNAFSPFDEIPSIQSDAETAYQLNDYGLVAIMCSFDINENGRFSPEYEIIKRLTNIISMFGTYTTTVLCLTSSTNGVKKLFKKLLPEMLFITIAEDGLSGEKAKNYLEKLAKSHNVEIPSTLDGFDDKQVYKATEIKKIFNNWYVKYVKTSSFPQYLKYVETQEAVMEDKKHAFDELENLVGLDEIKKVVKNYINYSKLQSVCEKLGKPAGNYCRHMLFTGNPGTAKTTVARIIAQIMKENGLLSKGNLIEVGRADIVSKFVGGTAPKVKELFQNAKGNVLFIDEAYSLCEGKEGMYGDEAINTIVQEMENNREDTVVIFAGYKKEMQEFIDRNSGLRSRIAYEIDFPDYSQDELMQIARLQAEKMSVDISECEEVIKRILAEGKKKANFGNGRFVRKVLESARMKQASRLAEQNLLNSEQISILKEEDFEIPNFQQEEKIFGFQI